MQYTYVSHMLQLCNGTVLSTLICSTRNGYNLVHQQSSIQKSMTLAYEETHSWLVQKLLKKVNKAQRMLGLFSTSIELAMLLK